MSACFERSVGEQPVLERTNLAQRQLVEIAVDAGVNHADLLFHLERRELRLLEELGQARAAVEQALGDRVEVGAELGEGRHLAVLRELALDLAGDLLGRLGLGRGADARHREADVHRRADALIEEVGLEEDLAVGDRDHVGRDIGRDVVGLRLDDRERGQRARAVVLVELGGALEQAGVQIEDVARDRLRGPAGGAAAATSGGRRRPACERSS